MIKFKNFKFVGGIKINSIYRLYKNNTKFIYNKKGDLDEMGKKNLILERRNKEINKFFEDFELNYVKYAQEEKNKNSKKEQKPIRVYIK